MGGVLADGVRRHPDGSLAEATLTFRARGVPPLGLLPIPGVPPLGLLPIPGVPPLGLPKVPGVPPLGLDMTVC